MLTSPMINLDELNPEQKAAAKHIEGPLVILAGAGTGKTRVITYRIAHMLDQGIDPDSIVAMTFTNKAAREMKERLTALAPKKAKKLHIGTFHSFCLKFLRIHGHLTGLDAKFSLVGPSEQMDFIRKALDEKSWAGVYQPNILLEQISRCKNLLLDPHNLQQEEAALKLGIEPGELPALETIYALYQRQLVLNRVIDFDDCIFEFIRLLTHNQEIREQLAGRLRYFLIDEFQDTNQSQLETIRLLAQESQNACVVGDDDQSIYSWRGAEPRIIEDFERIFSGSKLIKLEQNYRCSKIILDAANAVIANNIARKPKVLWSARKDAEQIALAGHMDELTEARWIAKKCFSLQGQGVHPRDIAILYRTNGQAKPLEIAFREMGLKYKVFGGNSFFEKKEVKDFLAYLKLTIDPDHRLAYWRIVNTPARGIGLKTQEKIESLAKDLKCSPFAAAQKLAPDLNPKAARALENLGQLVKDLAAIPLKTPEDIRQRGQQIIKAFKLDTDIRANTKNEKSRINKLTALTKMPSWLENLAKSASEDDEKLEMTKFLDQMMLSDENKPSEEKETFDKISLMTMHSAKGLEFPVVFLPGLEDDILPHKNSESPKAIAEERRLFYVAITRAKRTLTMSYAVKRNAGFQSVIKKPSRFLKELPDELIRIEGELEPTAQEAQSQRVAKFQNIRDRLKGGFAPPTRQ